MIVAFTVILVFLIVCATGVGIVYMCFCNENGEGMFASWKLEGRVKELEKQIKELKKE